MSSARPPPPASARFRAARAAGHTAIEIVIALVIVGVVSLAVERTLIASKRADDHLGGTREVLKRGERLGYELRELVSASRKLFQGDTHGQAYFDALDLHDPTEPIETLRLPMFDEVNGLGVDAPGDPRTGNAILFVREADPAPAVADPATGKLRYIDTFRFVCIYVAETDRYLVDVDSRKLARDLIVWRSVAFPSHAQILAVSDPDQRTNVVKDLYDRYGYEYCWNATRPVDDAFFELGPDGTVEDEAESAFRIELDPDLIERGKLVYGDVQLARTDPRSPDRRALLTVDNPSDWVPDGFEVKMVGTSGSRKVWMRIVIETEPTRGWKAVHSSTVIASTKDM